MVSFALDGAPEIPRGPGDFGGVSGVTLQRAGNLFVGRFRASDIPPGGYQWVVEIRDQRQPLEGTAITTSVDVRGGDMELRFDLPAAALALTGAVTLNGEAPKADKVRIWLQLDGASAKTDTYQKLAERFVLADNKTGAFSIPSVPLGHFHVMVGGPLPRDVYIEDVRSGNKSVFDAGFDIDTGEIPRLDIRLRAGGGSISGTVGDTQGKPVAGASVALVPASRESRGNPARFHSVTSDVDGKFNIASVAPGEYKLFAWSVVPSGAWFNATFLSRFEDKGTHVTVSRQSSSVTTELTTLTTAKP
jgi:hypothetical protein